MILDTSALLAILRDEPEAMACARAIEAAEVRQVSAANFLEAAIVIEPVTPEHARIGRQACRDFGRGSGHPARLNFGDCFACALARASGEPLLYTGQDFGHTDLHSPLPAGA